MLDVAEQLFARSSITGVTTRDITEAAEQKNASAVSYHFGSRQGLVRELLARRGAPIDEARGRLREALGESPDLPALVACLVIPYCAMLETGHGRSYVRIVAQLRGTFAAWRVQSDVATTQFMSSILGEIESRAVGSTAVRRERVIALIMLITSTTAERARDLDEGQPLELDRAAFVANLIAMCSAVQSA